MNVVKRCVVDSTLSCMATNKISIEVVGVAKAIKELRNLEPTVYRRLVRDLKTSARPLAKAVGLEFPDEPLVNWEGDGQRDRKGFPTYNSSLARNRVIPSVSTSKKKDANQYGILRIQQMDAGGAVYDSSGSKVAASRRTNGGRFVMNLDKRLRTKSTKGKTRSRVLYPAVEKHLPLILPAIQDSVRRTEAEVQKTINSGVI